MGVLTAFDPNQRVYHNQTSTYQVRGRVAYSEKLQARHIVEEAHFGDQKGDDLIDVLELYAEKKAYVINQKSRTCKVVDIAHPFIPYRPFDFANFTGTEVIGEVGGDNAVYLARFEGEGDYQGHHFGTYQTFAEKECLPVRQDHFDEETGFHYEQITDIEIKVNPKDFEKPTNCQ